MREDYHHLLGSAVSDQAVVDLAVRYLQAWQPAELASIPSAARPGAPRDVEELADMAFALTKARIDSRGPNALLDEMESFFARACARVSALETAASRLPGKSYLTR